MTDGEIFVPEPGDVERPTDYIANPVRVQLTPDLARQYGRPFQRMDLFALANSIAARETECRELRETVRALTARVSTLELRLSNAGSVSSINARALEAFADVIRDDVESEYDGS